MKVKEAITSLLFETETLRQETVIDALGFFMEKFKKLNLSIDAIYPGDPVSLPFCMYLSNKLSVPIKTERFLNSSEKVLVIFSYLPFRYIKEKFIIEKLKLFRKNFPNSPSLLVASTQNSQIVDFQLLKVKELSRINSVKFLFEAFRNFYYPVEGEFTYFSRALWESAKSEVKNFEKARRIRDSVRKYSEDLEEPLVLKEEYLEIALWERFKKNILVAPSYSQEREVFSKINFEKLIEVENRVYNSAIASLLEFLSQKLEYSFPTYLAYSSFEVIDKKGVVIIPKAKEVLDGVDLNIEVVLKSSSFSRDFQKLNRILDEFFASLIGNIFKEDSFKPSLEFVLEKEIRKASVYISWFLDSNMLSKLYRKVNKKWLLSRLLSRKELKLRLKELFKFLEDFSFSPENLERVFSELNAILRRSPSLIRLYEKRIKEIFDKRKLWPIVGAFGSLFVDESNDALKFLLSLKGYENLHEFLAKENRYFIPLKTKRIYRENVEKVAEENVKIYLKAEPLNPDSPTTYIVHSEDGSFLGTLPQIFSHYIFAKESIGKKITCRKLYFDKLIFSTKSYWIEVECL